MRCNSFIMLKTKIFVPLILLILYCNVSTCFANENNSFNEDILVGTAINTAGLILAITTNSSMESNRT